MEAKELKKLIKGTINAKDIKPGDVFISDIGYRLGKAVFVTMQPLKQSKSYKNEYDLFATVLIPPKRSIAGYKEMDEVYVTFSPRHGKFRSVPYLGKWNEVRKYFNNED
jgi:hypothetical protein